MDELENLIARVAQSIAKSLQAEHGLHGTAEASHGLEARTVFSADGEVLTAKIQPVERKTPESPQEIARLIDHTLLKPEATSRQIEQLCAEAREYHFAAVCVNPWYVRLAADLLSDVDDVEVATVVGFPLGATFTEVKVAETLAAIAAGATEIDMVMNIGALKSKRYDVVARDIRAVVQAAHAAGALVKVIIEAALLTQKEKVAACLLAKQAEADFVKTSTGFGPGGATVEDVALMRTVVGDAMGVKAAGGVRTYEQAKAMIAAGANRIGASAGVRIVSEAKSQH